MKGWYLLKGWMEKGEMVEKWSSNKENWNKEGRSFIYDKI